jgi:hypothetical protein
VVLTQIHRTSVSGLLIAASAIRDGSAPANGQGFKILAVKGPAMAAVYLTNAIAWRNGGARSRRPGKSKPRSLEPRLGRVDCGETLRL